MNPNCINGIDVIGCHMAVWAAFVFVAGTAAMCGVLGMPRLRSSDPHAVEFQHPLQKASAIIFLSFAILQACRTLILTLLARARVSSARNGNEPPWLPPKIKPQQCYTLCVVFLLLLVREAFSTALAMGDTAKLHNEHFWYPFIALPEILVVAFCVAASAPHAASKYGVRSRMVSFFSRHCF
ncbi:hypothetical protein BD779DRAFT_1518580 [Infundibulicybe gibba]|nr:hypothetical protein BD779DRAFT_1518580 [Infundibulicybe gibba]